MPSKDKTSNANSDINNPGNSGPDNNPPDKNAQSRDENRAFTIDEARDAILWSITCTDKKVSVELADAIGRTIATDITATTAIPPFTNSAMDGYAIRHQDAIAGQHFKIIGKSLAGHPFSGSVNAFEAVRITTGAAMPEGADAIVIQELVTVENNNFTTDANIKAGQYIRNPGDDIQTGQCLINGNTRLRAADVGLLAAQGLTEVEVYANPKVGVFSTGDELRTPDTTLSHGQIFDSNRTTIRAVLKNAGIDSVDLGICKDDKQALQAMMKSTDKLDFVLSSGGVSVGEADYVREVLQSNGQLLFWKVAMKPGKPLVSGRLSGGAHYFGLPGNPVSSMVTCVQFVIPAIHKFSGVDYQAPPTLKARCIDNLSKERGRFEFQRGLATIQEEGELTVATTGLQDSHVLSSMSKANCFICLDQFATGAERDQLVNIVLFSSIEGL